MNVLLIPITTFLISIFLYTPEEIYLFTDEKELYELLMEYRTAENLPPIPLSYSLTKVAKLHMQDLQENDPTDDRCNMHSWSNNGSWKGCCYTSDHKNGKCMWRKPMELT